MKWLLIAVLFAFFLQVAVASLSDIFDSMSKDQFLGFLSENETLKDAVFETIRALFDANDDGLTDEECNQIICALLTPKSISSRRELERISVTDWATYELSLRVLATDEELMENPKLASAVIEIFANIYLSDEGFDITLKSLAENVLSIHFPNKRVMTKFLRFADISRTGILDFLRRAGNLDTSLTNYTSSRIVRAYYNSFTAHFLIFYTLFGLALVNATNSITFTPFLFVMLAVASTLYFDNFMIPFL
jgi:hypothetical protein